MHMALVTKWSQTSREFDEGRNFSVYIQKCMYDIDNGSDFEKLCFDLINEYNIRDKPWIKSTYAIRKMGCVLYEGSVNTWHAKYTT
jgi:hypothetical protein